jgi:hypothetical protein
MPTARPRSSWPAPELVPDDVQQGLAARMRGQADWCAESQEPLYAGLLSRAADDLEAGGPSWQLMKPYATEPGTGAVPLRFLAGVHRLLLEGRLPELARAYTARDPDAAWPLFRAALKDHREELGDWVGRPCQTNEVGRSAALLGGFLELARAWRLPLRLLEVGTSAGLNLRWDRYRYEAGDSAWGDPASPVCLDRAFAQPPPFKPPQVRVTERSGCDLRPVDPTTDDGALTLAAFVWPSNRSRMELLQGAIRVAKDVPAEVERADAATWLERKLALPVRGSVTVVFHSVFVQYIPTPVRRRIERALHGAGRGAGIDAPLAWLRMEPGTGTFEVRLTTWPGGDERLIATCGPHGQEVRWRRS